MSGLIAGAQKVEFPTTLTEGVLASFHDEEQREADFKEFMMGEQHQDGGRHDLESRGMTTDNVGVMEDAHLNPYTPAAVPNEADYVQQIAPVQDTNWQQEYGRSENEKGELRKQLQAIADENFLLKQQSMGAPVELPSFFNAQSPQAQVPHQAQPQPQVPQPVTPPMFDPNLMPRIVDKEDGEPMLAEDVDRLLREKVAPVIYGMQNQLDQAQANTAAANQRLFEAEKARIGLTLQEEQMLVAQNPWLRGMREPQAYLSAIGQLKTQQAVVAQPAQAAPTVALSPVQQQEVRRRTFVEASRQAAGPMQTDSAAIDPNRLFAQKWAETMQLPYEKKAAAQRALLKARGAQTVSGYRDPSVLTQ